DEQTIKKEVDLLQQNSAELFNEIGTFVEQVNGIIDRVDIPTFVVQASKDEIINPESATFIYENIKNEKKDLDLKSTRLNYSHVSISYAVFCLKKKKYNTKM